jgi:hypothetical protein
LLTNGVANGARKEQKIFFVQPKAHQIKFVETNKTVITDLLWLVAFFEQCQTADKVASILEKIAKDKKQPKEKKTAHLSVMHSRDSCYWQHCWNKCNYHQRDQRDCNDQQPNYCH